MNVDLGVARLRPWRLDDARSLAQYANNQNMSRNLRDRFPHPYSEADAQAWLAGTIGKDPPLNLAIEVDSDAVGGIGLHPGEDVHRHVAEVGYWLGEPFWGRGVMTAVLRAMTGYALHDRVRPRRPGP